MVLILRYEEGKVVPIWDVEPRYVESWLQRDTQRKGETVRRVKVPENHGRSGYTCKLDGERQMRVVHLPKNRGQR